MALLILSLFISSFPHTGTANGPQQEGLRAIEGYLDYANMTSKLKELAEENPTLIHLEPLGTTWEGRTIWAVKISDNVMSDEDEPEVLIMGGHHGNELPAVEIPMKFIEFLADSYGKNLTVTRLVDSREIWVIPMVNPDGHEYSLEGHEWRKNRRPIDLDGDGTIDGIGVDINRNYGYRWGQETDRDATSHDPTSRIYCGPAPFSENETLAVKKLVDAHNFTVSMSFHTYGQIIYYPWGNAEDENGSGQDVLSAMADEMGRLSGYTPMEGRDAYPTTGDSDDWLFANKTCYPFTIEMGTDYVAPPARLDPMFQRILPAMTYAIDMAAEPERAKLPDWTLMAYMSGDNTLSAQVQVDLNEMAEGMQTSTNRANVVALADTDGTGDTKLYHLEGNGNSSQMVAVSDGGTVIPAGGEGDLSLPSTLSNFINWSVRNYPAQRYALVLWGHGGDLFTGVGPDKGRWLDLSDMTVALEWSGEHMNILGFDACYMGSLEIYDSLAPYSDFIVSSQVEEQEEGWNYTWLVKRISTVPETDGITLARQIVDSYADYYQGRGDVAIAAVDTHMLLRSFMPAFEAWASLMQYRLFPEYPVISRIRNASVPYYRDMLDLGSMLRLTNMTSDASTTIREASAYLLSQQTRVFVREFHSQLYNINGLGLYFPEEGPDSSYPSLFSSRWSDFLSEYISPVPYPGASISPDSGTTPFPAEITVALTSPEGTGAAINASTHISVLYSVENPFNHSSPEWREKNTSGIGSKYTARIPDNGEFSPEIWYCVHMSSGGMEFDFPWNAGIPVRAEDAQDVRFFRITPKYSVDLGISSVSSRENGVVNVPTSINVTVNNLGPVSENCTLSLAIDYQDGGEERLSRNLSVSADERGLVIFHITPAHAGNLTIRIMITGASSFIDPHPENNTATVKMWVDSDEDGDGIGDSVDADRDGDGYDNDIESKEGTDPDDPASKPVDTDGDGIPDDMDPDDDNDGYPDSSDAFPLDPNEHYNPVPMFSLSLILALVLLVMLILRHRRII